MKNYQQKLEHLASNLDPFGGVINEECLQIIKEIGLEEFIDNPFELTNEVLRRLHPEANDSNSRPPLQ